MKQELPFIVKRQAPGRKRLPILAVLLSCVLIVCAALYTAVQVANAEPDFGDSYFAAGEDSPAANPLLFTTTDPSQLRPVTARRAEEINAAMPISASSNPAATAISIAGGDTTSYVRAIECLTDAIYYEAANEPLDGQRAVAQVILNRMRHRSYPHTVCGVVYQGSERRTGCQFTFTCDGSLMRARVPSLWMRARSVALAALGGFVYAPVGWSTHYHADYVSPYWAPTLVKSAVIGRHIFYRLSDSPRIASLFSAHYAGGETGTPTPNFGLPATADVALATGSDTPVALAERPVLTRDGTAIGAEAAGAARLDAAGNPATRTLRTWVISAQDGGEAAEKAPGQPAVASNTN